MIHFVQFLVVHNADFVVTILREATDVDVQIIPRYTVYTVVIESGSGSDVGDNCNYEVCPDHLCRLGMVDVIRRRVWVFKDSSPFALHY